MLTPDGQTDGLTDKRTSFTKTESGQKPSYRREQKSIIDVEMDVTASPKEYKSCRLHVTTKLMQIKIKWP